MKRGLTSFLSKCHIYYRKEIKQTKRERKEVIFFLTCRKEWKLTIFKPLLFPFLFISSLFLLRLKYVILKSDFKDFYFLSFYHRFILMGGRFLFFKRISVNCIFCKRTIYKMIF